MVAFAKTSSSCNSTLEKCQHSLKSSFKKVKSQIQKGVNLEKAARLGYEEVCEYLEIWNKTILIQQRGLAFLSKSLTNIPLRELYTMGNTGLLRHEAKRPTSTKTRGYKMPRAQEFAFLTVLTVQLSVSKGM